MTQSIIIWCPNRLCLKVGSNNKIVLVSIVMD